MVQTWTFTEIDSLTLTNMLFTHNIRYITGVAVKMLHIKFLHFAHEPFTLIYHIYMNLLAVNLLPKCAASCKRSQTEKGVNIYKYI